MQVPQVTQERRKKQIYVSLLTLMKTKNNVSDSSSEFNTNYDNLLDAFKELHKEAQRLTFVKKNPKRKS